MNNFIKKTFSRFSFNTVDDVVTDISSSSYRATIDLQDAYRLVPIHPDDRKHFGLRWDFGSSPVYLTDNFVCFGSKFSPFIFTRLTDAVTRYMKSEGYSCYNYLDDFIADSYDDARKAQLFLFQTLRSLGFYISWKKVTSPSTYCRYLGIDIDANKQRLLLPEGKLHHELAFWQNKKSATKLQMQRLCGVLNFCCKVIHGGRVYMFHMLLLLKCFNIRGRINLPDSFYDDISWWETFAENFNGCADFFDPVTDTIELYTDACLTGLAAICQNDFYHAKLVADDTDEIYYSCSSPNPYEVTVSRIHGANIHVLELIAVLLAVVPWNALLTNCRVLCYCDNLQVCSNLCKGQTLCITVLLPVCSLF